MQIKAAQVPVGLPPLHVEQRHVDALGALAHRTRLEIVFLLVRVSRELAAGEIANRLGVHPATLSRHLDTLQTAGILDRRREGRFVYYSARPGMMSDLVRLFSACC